MLLVLNRRTLNTHEYTILKCSQILDISRNTNMPYKIVVLIKVRCSSTNVDRRLSFNNTSI